MGTVRHTDSIGRLCIALAHRWEPQRLFVIFTAYFDEADTHGPAPTVIMAAYLGHAYQWRRFEAKLARIQARFGFKVFHAVHFKGKHGEFRGWSDDKCRDLIRELANLVRSDLTEGLTVYLERERYLNEYRALPIPRKMNLDSQYGVCFRACIGRIIHRLDERGNVDRPHDKLHVVMEDGHTNVGDCARIFHDMRKRFERMGYPVLGTFTTAGKLDCPPLMVADMLAATHSMLREKRASPNPEVAEYVEKTLVRTTAIKGILSFSELAPGALRELKENFDKLRRLEAEAWVERRNAKKVAEADS